MSGNHRNGNHRADGADSGAYRPADVGPRPPAGSGGYPMRDTGPAGVRETGPGGMYATGPNSMGDTGPRPTRDTGSRRTGSGSHRIVREKQRSRRLAFALAGVVAGTAACVLAAVAIVSGLGVGAREQSGGEVSNSGASDSTPMTKGERSLVPDACELIGDELAGRLAPKADRTQADNYQSNDRQNQCVWGAYLGDRKRQLTVELRAIAATGVQGPTDAARASFEDERKADESGKALLATQELTEKRRLTDVGDDGYVVYSRNDNQGSGEAIANVRVVNVLVTVHYSGSNKGSPLSASNAIDGALEAAKSAVTGLNAG
ncbi:hypothetical protein ACGFNU_26235 [Spirillospora sp. NPDC048911]|uniref:hypothetical protein n=1 Tax=Spirillospora sp. NPDC048911 TaxID=3364527 RepID=UPI00371EC1C2